MRGRVLVVSAWVVGLVFFYPRVQMMRTSSCCEGECCRAPHLGPHCHISVFWSSSSYVFLSVRMRPVRIRLCWLCRVVLPILWHLLMRGPIVRRTKPRWSIADDTTAPVIRTLFLSALSFSLYMLLSLSSRALSRYHLAGGFGRRSL